MTLAVIGMPNSVLEALCVGLPVMLSDISPHREVYEMDERIGVLFSLKDNNFNDKFSEIINRNY